MLKSPGTSLTRNRRVLIAGVSTRAIADSAARVGFEVTAIDAFGDLDQHASVRNISLPRDRGIAFTARAAACASRAIECDSVVYLSSFENHPVAVGALAAGRALWGNAPDVLRRVRNPALVARTLADRGFPVPRIRQNGSSDPSDSTAWLVKPLRSGGGRRVRPWHGSGRIPRDCYLQERVEGTPGSIVFVASHGTAVPLSMTRQLVGDPAYGASGFQYCGNVLASSDDPQFECGGALVNAASELASAVTKEFDLVGVNGIDFIARGGVPYPIEVNPRWTASMELVERAFGLSMFAVHAAACERGTLPDFDLSSALQVVRSVGKAVVFARQDVAVGDTKAWLASTTVRDIPQPEERIAAGSPVCTVFAEGADASQCGSGLMRRAQQVYIELDSRVLAL